MKFYNPFKPHLAVNPLGEYSVRYFSFQHFGWMYLVIAYDWSFKYYESDYPYKMTKEEALSVLDKYLEKEERIRVQNKEYNLKKKTKYVEE